MTRDEAFWLGSMTHGFDHLTAPPEFARVCQGGSLIACHPYGLDKKPIRVAIDVARDADHFLFKKADDTHSRWNAMMQLPADFQQDRSDRMGWIPEVLRELDAIYADKREFGTFLFVCRTLP